MHDEVRQYVDNVAAHGDKHLSPHAAAGERKFAFNRIGCLYVCPYA
jgi:hypothetical protein